jgi:hypothetical protein
VKVILGLVVLAVLVIGGAWAIGYVVQVIATLLGADTPMRHDREVDRMERESRRETEEYYRLEEEKRLQCELSRWEAAEQAALVAQEMALREREEYEEWASAEKVKRCLKDRTEFPDFLPRCPTCRSDECLLVRASGPRRRREPRGGAGSERRCPDCGAVCHDAGRVLCFDCAARLPPWPAR